jgi:hypothetical protein
MVVSFTINSFAKKDINAWKSEKNLEQQFTVFKSNLNFWNGSYFMEPEQLSQFYEALKDSVALLEKTNVNYQNEIKSLQSELKTNVAQTSEIQHELDNSIKNQNSIDVFGMQINKNIYSFSMYAFILGVLALSAIVFLMFKRSNTITVRTKKEYEELKEEYEVHKKNALDRYTKMNMELHKTRLELNKK